MRNHSIPPVAQLRPKLLSAVLLLALPPAASALVFDISFTDEDGGNNQTWDSTWQNVVSDAANDWTHWLQTDNTVSFDATFDTLGTDGPLATANFSGGFAAGENLRPWSDGFSLSIEFNSDYMDSNLDNYLSFDNPGTPTANVWDALTVARHEVGHLLGFAPGVYLNNFSEPEETDPWMDLIDTDTHTFDTGGLDVAMYAGAYEHTDIADEPLLMNRGLTPETVYDVDLLHAEMIGTAWSEDWTVIPEPSTYALAFGTLAMGWVWLRRRRAARKAGGHE